MSDFKAFTQDDYQAIKKIINDKDRLKYKQEISEEYSHDELGDINSFPDIVVFVQSAEEVSSIMEYAYKHNIAVTPRGAGTGLTGGAVPINKGIMLDLSRMNRILELDEDNLTLSLEPGVLLMDLISFVEDKGYFYPPDPGEKSATIGGNISTNAGGMRAVKYGVTRDYVMSLDLVLPDGRKTSCGGKVVKNSSGYSIKDLIIGSEGTLAVVTAATLKLLPLPTRVISLLIPFSSLKQAIRTVPLIMKCKNIPTAVEFMEREVILDAENFLGRHFPDNSADAYLLLKYDGNSYEEIENHFEEAARVCMDQGAIDIFYSNTEEREESLWKARGAFLEAIKASTTWMDEVDVVVPRNCVNEIVEYIYNMREELAVRIKGFGHAGDGNLHMYILRDDLPQAMWEEKLRDAFNMIYSKAKELGGKVSGEHGIGYVKKAYLKEAADPVALDIMKSIKKAFDPKGILNPGKIIDDHYYIKTD